MLRYQIHGLKFILPKHTVFFSTRIITDEKSKRIPLIQKLSEEFTDVGQIKSMLKENEVKNIHFNEWRSRINIMKKYHFSDTQCFKMISICPSLLKIPLDKFETTTRQWFCAEFGIKSSQLLLLNQPILFEIDEETINRRLPYLRSLFRTSEALAELLMNSPNIMYDNWNTVLSKIHYLLKIRKFNMGEIMQSCALSKSLEFIKLRLDLLEKCGIYKQETKPIHKKNKYDKSRHKNPLLQNILLTNTKNFIKIAKISSEEYAVFRDLYMSDSDEANNENEDDLAREKSKYEGHI